MIWLCFCNHALQQGWQISFTILCPSSLGNGAKPIAGRFSPQCLHLMVSAITGPPCGDYSYPPGGGNRGTGERGNGDARDAGTTGRGGDRKNDSAVHSSAHRISLSLPVPPFPRLPVPSFPRVSASPRPRVPASLSLFPYPPIPLSQLPLGLRG